MKLLAILLIILVLFAAGCTLLVSTGGSETNGELNNSIGNLTSGLVDETEDLNIGDVI